MVSFPGDSTATLVLLIFFTATVSSVPESSGFPSAPTLPTPHTDRLLVGITFVHAAAEIGAVTYALLEGSGFVQADGTYGGTKFTTGVSWHPQVYSDTAFFQVCLDGSPPAYHLHRGFGSGAENWLLQFEGGGWCNDVESCLSRANTRRGSSSYMNRWEVFNGILSSRSALNPDFYNWNRVKIRYCDGASFAADSEFYNGTARLYFRGQRIWRAIVADLLSKGMINAKKALLSGCSAGGLSAILHCDDYANLLPRNTSVKCLSDGGFFLDAKDVSGSYTMRSFFEGVVLLQDVTKNLARECTSVQDFPAQCFFPQYQLAYIHTPMFILNTAYDIFQFNHILVPPSADPHGSWRNCKGDPNACTLEQIAPLQDFRDEMLTALTPLLNSTDGGIFVNSCFTHCQSEFQETWFSSDSPRLNNKTIAQSVGDWYFGREIIKETDCPYPCDETCYNPPPQEDTGR